MSETNGHAGADWLRSSGVVLSPLGERVADLVGELVQGIYHLGDRAFQPNWAHDHFIELRLRQDLATFDGNMLTRLVFLAHDYCIRVEVSPCNPQFLSLMFHQRKPTGSMWARHPSIRQALEAFERGRISQRPTEETPCKSAL